MSRNYEDLGYFFFIFWPRIICDKLSDCEILCDRELSSGSCLQPSPALAGDKKVPVSVLLQMPSPVCAGVLSLPLPAEGLSTPTWLSADLDLLCMKTGTWGRTCMHCCSLCMEPGWDQGIQRPGNHPEIPEHRYSQGGWRRDNQEVVC